MRTLAVSAVLLGSATLASAQGIDIVDPYGPSGTHIEHELPISSFTYTSDTYQESPQSFRYTFRTFKNGRLKTSESFDVINPGSPYHWEKVVSFSGWNLRVGDQVKYTSKVTWLSNNTVTDNDILYGDVVDRQALAPLRRGEQGELFAVLLRGSRWEELFG